MPLFHLPGLSPLTQALQFHSYSCMHMLASSKFKASVEVSTDALSYLNGHICMLYQL